MKKKICVVTGTRAEYGLLRPVMDKIKKDEDLLLQIIVTGAHLSSEFGLTYREIEKDGFVIDEKVEMLLSVDSDTGMVKSTGLGMIGFADAFRHLQPTMLLVLGDRYEIFAAASAAMLMNIPIAHIHGGELTYGAVDDSIRHCITKMSLLHFPSTEEYRQRIIRMGESPERVFNVGALGVENIRQISLMSREELTDSLQFEVSKDTALVTFHPVTREADSSREQFRQLLSAIDSYDGLRCIFTKANADTGGREINQMIDDFVERFGGRHIAFASMGQKRYLSAMKWAGMVIGNSSSGIIEAPSFHIPTVNIGTRQEGRVQAESVVNCEPNENSIRDAIERAVSDVYTRPAFNKIKNPYEKENTSEQMVLEIKNILKNKEILLKKAFYEEREGNK